MLGGIRLLVLEDDYLLPERCGLLHSWRIHQATIQMEGKYQHNIIHLNLNQDRGNGGAFRRTLYIHPIYCIDILYL